MVKLKGAVVLTVCGLATACLITNCPKGGKRSKMSESDEIVLEPDKDRICVRCGPGLLGRCLGPALCCGPRLGCLMAAPGVLTECEGAEPGAWGQPCLTSSGLGVCASYRVCCDSDSCRIDPSCDMELSADVCSTEEILLQNPF